jgi:hypothetical protein
MLIFNREKVHLLGFCQLWHEGVYYHFNPCSLNLALEILALVCTRNQMFAVLKEWEYLELMWRKTSKKMKINILWVDAEGTAPRQHMYSLLVVKGLRITLKCSTPSSYSGCPWFESLTGECLSWLRFCGFHHSLQPYAMIPHWNWSQLLPSKSLPIHHSQITLTFNATWHMHLKKHN